MPFGVTSPLHCTLYHRAPGFAAIAEAELLALGGGGRAERGVWLSPTPIRWTTTGYGITGGRQLASAASVDGLVAQVKALHLAVPRFSIAVKRIPRTVRGALAASRRVADAIDGRISIADPLMKLLLVASSQGYRLLVEDEVSPNENDWLRVQHRPHNLPTSLPVRLGQAMLNLTARPGDTVLDPFCGTGTIPLLASLRGHRSFGSDISKQCVELATKNLVRFGQVATIEHRDATEVQQRADCLVTNLPYGLYSHVASNARPAILRNLATLAPRATFVTSKRVEDDLDAAGFVLEQTISLESERFERFVYVTRAAR